MHTLTSHSQQSSEKGRALPGRAKVTEVPSLLQQTVWSCGSEKLGQLDVKPKGKFCYWNSAGRGRILVQMLTGAVLREAAF